jgi:flagellar motor switch protein FliN
MASEQDNNSPGAGDPGADESSAQAGGGTEEFQAASFDAPQASPASSIQEAHLDVILDVPVTLSMEVGRIRMAIRDLLQLNPGTVVKLSRGVGDPMDILVNGCLVAKGEVVTLGDKFGIRITDVVSPEERIKTLR